MSNVTLGPEWRPARRSKIRCAACGIAFVEGLEPPPRPVGPYAGEHVCAACRAELGLTESLFGAAF